MNEELLHYIWKFQLFNHTDLRLTSKEEFLIVKPGIQNYDAGPDFFNGQIKIADTIWVGNIEIHTKSSDWNKHNHQHDQVYNKIILHVVWEDDEPVKFTNGEYIPTVELKGLVSKTVIEKYSELQTINSWVPCATEIQNVSEFSIESTKSTMLVERLERKNERIQQLLQILKNDWEAVLFQTLAKYFGFLKNAVPFELLVTSIEFSVLRKMNNHEEKIAALLFGQAGMLDGDFEDEYVGNLVREYKFIRTKFRLSPIDLSLWKFMRMRPSNFPTIRIAQFAKLYSENVALFNRITEVTTIQQLVQLFSVDANPYWDNRFRFDQVSKQNRSKKIGVNSVHVLIINAVIPILFAYGKATANNVLVERSLRFLEELPSETNSIVNNWKKLQVSSKSAFDSQALIQLKNEYCSKKRCLECKIGSQILNKN